MDAEKLLMQLVEDKLLEAGGRRNRRAFQNANVDITRAPLLDMSPARQRLNFAVIKQIDPTLQVAQSVNGIIRLTTRKHPLYRAGIDFLSKKHPGHNIRMTEDILSFEPEEGLINMSENPLWIVQPENEFQVAIKRIF